MPGTIDDRYFEWLYSRIGAVRNRNPARSYWELARKLYSKEFVWLIPNDDNRVEDGKELRREFLDELGTDGVDPEWVDLGCSLLEVMYALARRASDEHDIMTPGDWFWLMMENVGLKNYTDARIRRHTDEEQIDEILDAIVYRTYSYDGSGGLFPLREPRTDQRKVELWYQLAAYILEEYPL